MYHIKADKRTETSAKLITEAVLALMEEKSFDEITITEVQRRSGVSRSTFYRSFDKLEDVLELLCDQGFRAAFERGGNLPVAVYRYWSENSRILETLVKIHRTDILYTSFRRTAADHPLIQGLKEDEAQYDYFVSIVTSGMVGILTTWVEHGKTETGDQVLERSIGAIATMAEMLFMEPQDT